MSHNTLTGVHVHFAGVVYFFPCNEWLSAAQGLSRTLYPEERSQGKPPSPTGDQHTDVPLPKPDPIDTHQPPLLMVPVDVQTPSRRRSATMLVTGVCWQQPPMKTAMPKPMMHFDDAQH